MFTWFAYVNRSSTEDPKPTKVFWEYKSGGVVRGENPNNIPEEQMPTCVYVGGIAGSMPMNKDGTPGKYPCYVLPEGLPNMCLRLEPHEEYEGCSYDLPLYIK